MLMYSGDSKKSTSESQLLLGIFLSITAAVQFFTSPSAGALSNSYGRKPFLLISGLAIALLNIVMIINQSLTTIFIAAILRGFDCTFTIGSTIIPDLANPKYFIDLSGKLGAAAGIGILVGVSLGAGLATVDIFHLPFLISGISAVLNMLIVKTWFTETRRSNVHSVLESNNENIVNRSTNYCVNPFKPLRSLQSSPQTLLLSIAFFISQMNLVGIFTFLFSYCKERYDWDDGNSGAFVFSYTIAASLSAIFFLPELNKPNSIIAMKLGELGSMKLSLLALQIQLLSFIFIPTSISYSIYIILLFSWPSFLITPIIRGWITRTVTAELQGNLQGSVGALSAIASIISPLLFSGVYSYFTSNSNPVYAPYFPFIIAWVFACISTGLLYFINEKYALPLKASINDSNDNNINNNNMYVLKEISDDQSLPLCEMNVRPSDSQFIQVDEEY